MPINKTMSRDDLKEPQATYIKTYLDTLIQTVKACEGAEISSWTGILPPDKPKLPPEKDSRNYHYEPIDSADEDRFPWFLYWEIFWVVRNAVRFFPRHGRVLDIGGASSLFTAFLASLSSKNKYEVHSIDIDEILVENSFKLARLMKWQLFSYLMDARELFFKSYFFDSVFSICTFEHMDFEVKQLALKEIHRVLKPQGSLAITFDYKNPAPGVVGVGREPMERNRISTPEDIERQFLNTGLFKIKGNKAFFDNNELYLFHPRLQKPYTFGALFLEKNE